MLKIREYKDEDIFQAALLIYKTFRTFNYHDNDIGGSEEYIGFYNPQSNLSEIKKRFDGSTLFFVAENEEKIIGLLRAVENRIVNLFVNESFHGQGIGKRLVRYYERECEKAGYKELVLRSQLYAISFYRSCGFKKISDIEKKHGLTVQPMKKILN